MMIGMMLLILGFAWLLVETRFLTIRLPVGPNPETSDNTAKGGMTYDDGRGKAPRVLSVNPVVRGALADKSLRLIR